MFLDHYKDNQNVAYNILANELKNNTIGHAYLIDQNGNLDAFSFVVAFVKDVLCASLSSNEKDILCKKIDDGNYPELKIISPDGMFIKKQQILDLQKDFSMSAIEGNKRIYIVKDADKMRNETANSMLKFLEEPDNNIMAILMTNNFNGLLSTIISRCQVIRLNNNGIDDSYESIESLAIKFIEELEKNGIMAITKEQELIFDVISVKEREKFVVFFDKMIEIYYDILKVMSKCKDIRYNDYYEIIFNISQRNSHDNLLKKIKYLIDVKDSIKNNVNINLLIDSVIINFGG